MTTTAVPGEPDRGEAAETERLCDVSAIRLYG